MSSDAEACEACPPSILLGKILALLGKILELRRKGKLKDGPALAAVSGVVELLLLLLLLLLLFVVVLLLSVLVEWQMAWRARAGDVAKSKST